MDLQIYELKFDTVHFGDGLLESSMGLFTASRIFSAMFIEAINLNLSDELYSLAISDDFVLSDALIHNEELFLPKPIGYPKKENQKAELNRVQIKQLKKIEMIPSSIFYDFIQGNIDVDLIEELYHLQQNLWKNSIVTRKGEDPYRVGIVSYYENVKVVFISIKHPLIETLLESLQYTGIGGKKSTGLGKFELTFKEVPKYLKNKITQDSDFPVMLLTTAIPIQEQLANTLKDANYLLIKSSGFADSSSNLQNLRKQDLYKFKIGSTFNRTFQGDIFDVSPDDFPHPVWNYSKPLFLKLG